MRPLDWAVLVASLLFIVLYGLWRGRGSNTTNAYLLAGRTMPWYAMALSIMATQASAITFISTTGQSYVDGMRFVQFYFGLPLAMILISAVAVPLFHRSGVYTAYEYLERRFDARVRALASVIFLIQRGLAVGLALYAPAVVLTVILGWPDQLTTFLMGALVIAYTVYGGIQAVTWTDVQQMAIMLAGLLAALVTALWLLPPGVSPLDALRVAGAAGRLNPVVWTFNPDDRYNVWSGLIGGMFLALAYFGCDQSQVQRYLTGKSIAHSRISLLFNAVAKIPMQFLILLTGALVFVFYVYQRPPILFEPSDLQRVTSSSEFPAVEQRYNQAFDRRRAAALEIAEGRGSTGAFRAAQNELDAARRHAARLTGNPSYNDTNYIFLTFVTRYLPAGVVGLVLAAIFAAAMSTISAEINSLATVTVIDIYKRHLRKDGSDRHYLLISQLATAFWGLYAMVTAQYGRNLGSLIEAVNMVGSLFYGGLLGVFVLAFFFPRATAAGAFYGVLAGEAAIFAAHFTTSISFLWYNVIGPLVVVAAGLAVSYLAPAPKRTP
ncbi:MAG: sodium:solute symporter [Bryobacteraceae bacterium]|nr:sodium:solute symporter [Bryobacteraceae bacterium]